MKLVDGLCLFREIIFIIPTSFCLPQFVSFLYGCTFLRMVDTNPITNKLIAYWDTYIDTKTRVVNLFSLTAKGWHTSCATDKNNVSAQKCWHVANDVVILSPRSNKGCRNTCDVIVNYLIKVFTKIYQLLEIDFQLLTPKC